MEYPDLQFTAGGARYELRLPDERDCAAIVEYYTRNREHFRPTDPPKPDGYYTEKFWRDRVQKFRKDFENDVTVQFYIFRDKRPLGSVSFTQICRGPFQACYLGYGLDEKEQRKGLMTEAIRCGLRYIFEERNLHRVMANHLPSNARSAAVLKRLGFAVEGQAKEYLLINGQWHDHVLNSLTNRNWKEKQHA